MASMPRRRPREWSSLVTAMRDPARSDFAFVPHQYVYVPSDSVLAILSPSDTTPINGGGIRGPVLLKNDVPSDSSNWWRCLRPLCGAFHAQANAFFWLHVVAIGMAAFCCAWLALFPIAPSRLYNMQVDVFNSNHAHADFFYKPCLYLGMIFGAAAAGYLGDRLGRAGTLELAAVPYVLGWLLHAVAYGEITVLFGRYLLGASAGMMSVVTPIYLAEISDVLSRGRLVCMLALLGVVGRLCYLAVGMTFVHLSRQYVGFNLSEWKLLAMVGVVPGVGLLLLMQRLPDSPTWLIAQHDDREAAFSVIFQLSNEDYQRAEDEVNGLIHASVVSSEKHIHHGAFFLPLWLCCVLFALRVVTARLIEPTLGSAPTNSFAVTVFGVGVVASDTEQLAVLGALQVAALIGIVSCFFIIDVRGRVMALQSGCSLVVLGCLLVLFNAYREQSDATVRVTDQGSASLLLITAGYQLGLGVGPIVLLGELFPTKHRVRAASVICICDAFVELALALGVRFLRSQLSFSHMFRLGVGLVLVANIMGVLIAWFYLPETGQRSLQSIEAILSGWYPDTPQQGQSRVRLSATTGITIGGGGGGDSDATPRNYGTISTYSSRPRYNTPLELN